MAERLALTLSPPAMVSSFGTHAATSSLIVPGTSAAAPSTRLSFSSSSSSTTLASLRFLRSSPPVSHLFLNSKVPCLSLSLALFVCFSLRFIRLLKFCLFELNFLEAIAGASRIRERSERRGYSEMRGPRSRPVEGCQRGY